MSSKSKRKPNKVERREARLRKAKQWIPIKSRTPIFVVIAVIGLFLVYNMLYCSGLLKKNSTAPMTESAVDFKDPLKNPKNPIVSVRTVPFNTIWELQDGRVITIPTHSSDLSELYEAMFGDENPFRQPAQHAPGFGTRPRS